MYSEDDIKHTKVCIDKPGPFILYPDIAASKLGFSQKAKEVFLSHLMMLKLKNRNLIVKNKFGEYFSNFTADEIIACITEVIED